MKRTFYLTDAIYRSECIYILLCNISCIHFYFSVLFGSMTLGNSKQNGCNIAQKAKTKFNSKNLGM